MKKIILLLSFILFMSIACKKEGEVCYKCTDAFGNDLQVVCGKDEQDAFDHSGIIEGIHDINVFRQRCKKK